jgi:ubiquinone/menaquinone biosynthesis C-methylase UbiE
VEIKTHYVGHDEVYQQRLADGAIGWDGTADDYVDRFRELDAILSDGRAPESGRLLELGCGAGNMGMWWANKGYTVRGIDIAPTAVALAQERAVASVLDVAFHCGNVVHLQPFEDDSFDIVYDSHLIHCIIGDDRPTLFNNVRRVLKPGGWFLVTTMVYSEKTHELQGFDPETGYTFLDLHGETLATRYIGKEQDLLEEVESYGFAILHSEVQLGQEKHGQLFIEATLRD